MLTYQYIRNCPVTPSWRVFPGLFTPQECPGLAPSIGPRQVPWSYMPARWLFERMLKPVASWNEEVQFEIFGVESLHITAYAKSDPNPWKTGLGADQASEHKIGILVALSGAQPETKGRMEFFANERHTHVVELGIGDAVVWPAWMEHRINAVGDDKFWTMEAWYLGPPFV